MNDALFERILLPLAGPDDADRTARAIRPYIESGTTLVICHITQGESAETAVKTGQDQFAQTTYETFVSLFDRSDVQLRWATLEGREVTEALTDAADILDATVIVYTPRDLDSQSRLITADPGSQLVRNASVPVMAFPE